jgi:hypothetical protein
MSPTAFTASTGSVDNHFTRAFQWEGNACCSSCTTYPTSIPPSYHVNRPWASTAWQLSSICRAQLHGSRLELEQRRTFNQGAATFLATMSPTAVDLIEHTQQRHQGLSRHSSTMRLKATALEISLATWAAWESVRSEYNNIEATGLYGRIACDKPDDVICVMYENFSSLRVFSTGSARHKKIQQITTS